jgi:putative endopeptidase
MKISRRLLVAIVAFGLTAFCFFRKGSAIGEPRTVFFDKTGMDTTVSPGENFYLYANGNWLKKTTIPASEKHWGTFNMLSDNNLTRLYALLEELAATKSPMNSTPQKVGDLYRSGMDTTTIDKLGYSPVKLQLAKIAAVTNYHELVAVAATGFRYGNGFLFDFKVAPDDKVSSKNVAHFDQAELSLPNRAYYFASDSLSENIRREYVRYISKIFILSGVDASLAVSKAKGILELETKLASSSLSPVDLRMPEKNYNKFAVADLGRYLPHIDMAGVLTHMDIKTDSLEIGQISYYRQLDSVLASTSIATWKDKATFETLDLAAPLLSKSFRDANFDFYDRLIYGRKEQKPRWKVMTSIVDDGLGELLGQVYVKRYFSSRAKQRVLDLVNNLQSVYRDRIQHLDWMSAETKEKAIAKLNAITKLIAYPDIWRNYDDVSIRDTNFYANEKAIAAHNYKEMIAKLNKAVDKSEFQMTPPTVGAYYNVSYNKIAFSAGILEFPFFDENADDAINYGGIGMVIAHEMTHGFDDQGRQYDKDGNLKDWWTPEDATKFNARVKVVVDQYNGFNVLDTHLNGNLTQGENLADIGGVAIAFEAFKKTPQGKSNDMIDGFTPDQRFFLGLAQIWRDKTTDAALRFRINNDPHSPAMFRVNGPVSNSPAFYKAFNIRPGDKMYRPDSLSVRVW